MRILIAPNAFKHALSAKDAAQAIQQGLLSSRLSCSCECFPIGDGGNGTSELIIERLQGTVLHMPVGDPLGRPISAVFGLVDSGRIAVIDMADASGLHLLRPEELNPLQANSYGTGQLIMAALNGGARKIVIGMGGSATVDGGSGMLSALGVRFLDRQGRAINDLPMGLENLHTIDCSRMDTRLQDCEITILCDVVNPLLGAEGAARVFGPQKGASPGMVEQLEARLAHYAEVIERSTGNAVDAIPSGGVAGGASAGLAGILGAQLVDGITYFLDLTGFDKALAGCQLVITGEGSIDVQTLQGKGPYGVAKRARQAGVPIVGLAGKVPTAVDTELARYFDVLLAIGNESQSLEAALPLTAANLTRTAQQLGNLIAALPNPSASQLLS
ncbi:glycerate kinase [Parapedobacter deserti]|uniref:Glycerate kinase n=1 Tax=Parapedobacter deserti TaxID=1912957 RepID=A0ABV7JJG1_9SPHI